jgi:plasmid stabilization system protein ParE
MKVIVREKVDQDLDAIFAWIAQNNPRAAAEMIRRIRHHIGYLSMSGLEHMGRPGLDPGTRELVEPPYVIVYEVHEAREEVEVLYVVHGAQDREGDERQQ